MKQHLLSFFIIFAFVLLGSTSLQAQKLLEKPVIDNVVVVFDWDTYASTIAELATNSVSTSEVEENICDDAGSSGNNMNSNNDTHTHTEENPTSQAYTNNNNQNEGSSNNTSIVDEPTDTNIILQTTDALTLITEKVYPNPATDLVNITVSNLSATNINIISLSGQVVAQWHKAQSQRIVISVADIPRG
ncbi:MAG: T9SS type A sorting domain-containing protein, partial [Chitinophagales bacterium]